MHVGVCVCVWVCVCVCVCDKFQYLWSTRLHQSAITDADVPMCLFTSILKDIAEETIPTTSAVPKRFNKPWWLFFKVTLIFFIYIVLYL